MSHTRPLISHSLGTRSRIGSDDPSRDSTHSSYHYQNTYDPLTQNPTHRYPNAPSTRLLCKEYRTLSKMRECFYRSRIHTVARKALSYLLAEMDSRDQKRDARYSLIIHTMNIRYRRTPRQEVASRIFHSANWPHCHCQHQFKMQTAWEIAWESIWVTK